MIAAIPAPKVVIPDRRAVYNQRCIIGSEGANHVSLYYSYAGVKANAQFDKANNQITSMSWFNFGVSQEDAIADISNWLGIEPCHVVAWLEWLEIQANIVYFHVGDRIKLTNGCRTSSDDKNWIIISDPLFQQLDPDTWTRNQKLKAEYIQARNELAKYGGAGVGFRNGQAGVDARARAFAAMPREGSCWLKDLQAKFPNN